ncbi:MAG TPA: nucleoside deaminase [Bacteroidia bacterium]|nr:nucleoside deaminase [Bacteroidia bacterium]
MPNKDFMKAAILAASEGLKLGKGGPFGAVVVKDGKIIAVGSNHVTSTNDPTAHAEVMAIREACRVLGTYQLSDCEIYTSCEPCPMCMGAIYWARPKKVYYASTRHDAAAAGFDDSFIYDELNVDPKDRAIPFINLDEESAATLFSTWNTSELKKEY